MEEAIEKLEDLEAQVAELATKQTGSAKDFKDWIDELVDMSSLPESRPRTLSRRMSGPLVNVPVVITERYLAELTRNLDRARHSKIRWIDEWDRLVQDAADTQLILDSSASQKLELGRASPRASFLERFTLFTPYSRYVYYSTVVPYIRILLGVFFSLASVCIVWSEFVKGIKPFKKLSVISLTVVHHPDSPKGQIGFAGQFIAAMWICYMCAAALVSVTEVKVWNGRALVRRNTAYESAFWYAMQVARLSVPLAYNFMTFLQPETMYDRTVFYHFLGRLIDLTPFGEWFDYLFPMFILVPVCATLFNLYGRAKRVLGYGVMDDDDEGENDAGYGTGGWREGRTLIERELHGDPRTLSGLHPSSTPDTNRPNFRPTPSERNAAGVTPARALPAARSSGPATDTAPEDENFFQALGHRMKNTVDTFQKPKWVEETFKTPKWMTGDDGGSSNGPFTKLFGGSARDSQVRL